MELNSKLYLLVLYIGFLAPFLLRGLTWAMLYVWTKNYPQVVGTCSGHHGQLISQNCVLTKIRAEPPPLKLEKYGIKGPVLNIIRNFLSSRSLRTSVRGCYSASRDVLSGVPQGSVLGPLLFVLFVNDLPDELKNATKLFADDLKLIVNASNKLKTNEDLCKLEKWESLWLIKFNPSKCKVMHLAYNNNPIHEYFLDGVLLEEVKNEKDLGLIVNEDLGWDDNIRSCIKDANRCIAWVSRNLLNRDSYILARVYKTIIRPKLEYCVQLWNPAACHGNWSVILELESIQRRFTRLTYDIGLLPYSKRLEKMNLTTLGERRIRGDLMRHLKL